MHIGTDILYRQERINLSRKQEFKIYWITKEEIFRFIVIEMLISSMAVSLGTRLFHNAVLAGAGAWACTEGMKWIGRLKFLNG